MSVANHWLHQAFGNGEENCCGREYLSDEEVEAIKKYLINGADQIAYDENGAYLKPRFVTGIGPAPGYGKALRASKFLYRAKDGVYRWIKNGRVASRSTLKRFGLSKPNLTTSRGRPYTPTIVETPPSGVNIKPGPKTFWQQVREAIALIGQLGG